MSVGGDESGFEIGFGEHRLRLEPRIGGAVASYRWRAVDILRPAPDGAAEEADVRAMGCFPLVPYSNRIEGARLRFGDEAFALRANFPPEPHAIHGVGWRRPWRVVARDAGSAELALSHAPDEDWPYRFEARQSMRLASRGLEADLAVRNLDQRAMPVGLGFHPYFPSRATVRLQARWGAMWRREHGLAVQRVATPRECDFAAPRRVADWVVDNCFADWERSAVLDYPGHRVTLEASPGLEWLVCFAPGDGRDFIALEPVSHVPNAFALASRGHRDTGMRALRPGEAWSVSMRISVAAPEAD